MKAITINKPPTPSPRVVKPTTPQHTIHGKGTIVRKRFEDGKYYEGEVTGYDTINEYYKIAYTDGDTEEYDNDDMKRYYKAFQRYAKPSRRGTALQTREHDSNFDYRLFPTPKQRVIHRAYATGGTIWDPQLNKMAHYRDLIIHPNPDIQQRWMESGENEFGRLCQGYPPNDIEGLDVIEFIPWDTVPKSKVVTYARYTVAYRPEKDEKYRTRITAGGDRLEYDGDVSTQVSTMETFKILLNSTVSTKGAKMFTGDISNMYLQSSLEEYEYVRFRAELIPPKIIAYYKLTPMIHNGHIYAKVKKAWYGLKQSGRIAHDDLVDHLAKFGYKKARTEGLFVHETRDIAFTLVVDDFAVCYTNKNDADHLIDSIRQKYPFKVDWEAKQYIGINLKWNYDHREVTLSMDG